MSRSYQEPDWAKLIGVFLQATTRMQNGAKVYGQFDPITDPRDLLAETQEELLDAMNYLAMHYLKIEEMRRKAHL